MNFARKFGEGMLGWFKKSVPGLLGMELSPFGVAVAYMSGESRDGQLLADCQHFEGAIDDCMQNVAQWLADRQLQQVNTQVVLHPALYQLYFVDRPEVDDAQLSEAARWKIKDLVDTPLKDLVIDAFPLPDDAYRGAQKKIYVTAMDRAALEEKVTLLKSLPIKLLGIGISELADRSILHLLHEDEGGVALLRLRSATGSLILVDNGDLYLTRNIDSSVSVLESARQDDVDRVLDNLLLEVQRCMDFYDSQLGKGSIRKMVVAPTRLSQTLFDGHLRGHLGMQVHTLDLNEAFSFPETMTGDKQSLCFAAVAAATEGQGAAL